MKIDSNISKRISILRFPLIVGIVFIHSAGTIIHFSDGMVGMVGEPLFVSFVQKYLSGVLAQISVPLFFTISGYLFFQNYVLTVYYFSHQIRTKLKTLILPYIIWNSISLLIYYILQTIPVLNQFFSGKTKFIFEYGMYDYLNAYLGLRISVNSPISYQFWFIRDLFVIMFFSPLMWLCLCYLPILSGVLFSLLWFFSTDIIIMNISSSALLFFYIGAVFQIRKIDLSGLDRYGPVILLVYILISLLIAFLLINDYQYAQKLNRLTVLPGMVSVWYLAGKVLENGSIAKILTFLSGFSFFVFAVHEPFLLGGIRKSIYRFTHPSSCLDILVSYFTAPFLAIVLSLLLGIFIKSIAPNLYGMLTGWRRR